jgi:hypothetical protein
MTRQEAEAARNREALAEFIRNKVVADFDCDDLDNLRKYIKDHDEDVSAAAFCDFLELGNWFYEAMIECDFDVERFMDELEVCISAENEEAAELQADEEADYRSMVGNQ